jgi:hypothetical protein
MKKFATMILDETRTGNGLLRGQCVNCIFGINGMTSCNSGRELARIASIGSTNNF